MMINIIIIIKDNDDKHNDDNKDNDDNNNKNKDLSKTEKDENNIKNFDQYIKFFLKKKDEYLNTVIKDFKNIKVVDHVPFDTLNEKYEDNTYYSTDNTNESGNFGKIYFVKIKNLPQYQNEDKNYFCCKEVKMQTKKDIIDKNPLESIYNEIKNLIRLKNKDHILQIIDCYKINNYNNTTDSFYIVTEYCKGETLTDFINYNNNTENDKINISCQIIESIKQCHDNKIAHRDLKPDNIIINKKNNIIDVKIIDFGESCYNIDTDNKKLGTLENVSYELYNCNKENEMTDVAYTEYNVYKNDIYSLGVVLYNIFTSDMLYTKAEMDNGHSNLNVCLNNTFFSNLFYEDLKSRVDKNLTNNEDLKDLLKNLLCEEKSRYNIDQVLASNFYKKGKKKIQKLK